MSSAQLGIVVQQLRKLAVVRSIGPRPDRQLLDDFIAHRDEDAFAALVRRHGPMVLNVCRGVLRNQHDAEDVFQATFLVLARKAASIRHREAVGGWLCEVAYRLALKEQETIARRRGQNLPTTEQTMPDPLLDMTLRELHQVMMEELHRLPEKYRLPLVLCYLEGRTQTEAASQLGWLKDVLRGRLNRGRTQLRARLIQRGLALTAGLFASTLTAGPTHAALPAVQVETLAKAAVKGGGLVSERVAALAAEAARGLFAGHGKIATILVLMLGIVTAGAGLWTQRQLVAQVPAAAAAQPVDAPAAPASPKPNPVKPQPESAIEIKGDTIAVSGRVLDPDGKPFAGAKLYLTASYGRSKKPAVRATSGSDGRFHFTFPKTEYFEAGWIRARAEPWRWCDIVAAAPGYGPGSLWMPDVKKELSLRLLKDARIGGRVRDLEGRPVAGAEIRVIGPSWAPLLDASTTDKQGRFTLAGAGCGREVELRIAAPAIETHWVKVKTPADGAEVEVLTGPTKPVVGVVRGRDTGKPLAGVEVWAMLHGWPRGEDDPHILRAVTDERGRYRLLGLPKAAKYELTVVPPVEQGYVITVKQAPDTEGLKPISLDFDLTRGVIVRFRLIDKETGQPVRGNVQYTPLHDNPFHAEATHLEPGVLPPRVFFYGHETDKDNFIQFVAYPGPGVIYAHNGWGGRVYLNARLDPEDEKNGHYPGKKGDPLNGFLEIVPGYRRIDTKQTDRPLVFDIPFDPGRTLAGSLVDADGRPVRGATAWGLKLGNTPRGAARTGEQTLETEAFTATGLDRHQPCTLSFLHRGRKFIGQVAVRPEDKGPLTVRLQPWGALKGRLVDAEGKPLAGVKMHLEYPNSPDAGMRPPLQAFSTGRDGRFRVEGLLPGLDHELILSHGAKTDLTLSAGETLKKLKAREGEVKDLGDIAVKVVPAPKEEKKNG